MNILTLDFETHFSDDYSLSKMSTEAYVRDPRFEALGCSIKAAPNKPAVWFPGEVLPQVFARIDWANTAALAHHAQFDGLILSHHFNMKPKFWLDTLSMARLLLGNHLSVALANLAKHFNLEAKNVPYNLFKGKHWHELPPIVQQQVGDGANHDVDLTWQIFQLLAKDFPREEFDVVDTTIRMFTESVLRADIDLLGKVWKDENDKKQNRLEVLGVSEADLQSADKFAALLREAGCEPETKTSPKGKEIYAFAKTDEFMRDILEDDNDRVRTLAEARLGVKSTLLQTRAETLGFMASRGPGGSSSPLPVYLRYAGAGTLRVSGGDGANWLNFKRRSPLRKAILAPDGFLLAPVDSSQIECRVCHYLAGGPDEPVIEIFRQKGDPYVGLASQFYGETIYKPAHDDPRKDEMEAKRGMGKQGRLMCQYGASGKQFKITAKNGLYGPSVDIELEDANNFVALYRQTNPSICAPHTGYWAQCNRMLSRLAGGDPIEWGPLLVKDKRIYIQGRPMIYDTLEYYTPGVDEECRDFERNGYWRVKTRYGWKTLWGSKLTQNICEGVSRVIVSEALVRLKHLGYRTLNWPYDELLLLIPDDQNVERHKEIILAEMTKTPTWLPGLPLDAEVTVAKAYSK